MYRLASTIGIATIFAGMPVTSFAQLQVSDAWVRGTVPAQTATGAFMDITSKATTKLVAAASPVAGKVEIHSMKMENGVMKMAPVPAVDLPANTKVTLGPGGFHVMLMDLKQQLKPGDKVPLTLTTEGADKKRQTTQVTADVRELTSALQGGGGGQHKH